MVAKRSSADQESGRKYEAPEMLQRWLQEPLISDPWVPGIGALTGDRQSALHLPSLLSTISEEIPETSRSINMSRSLEVIQSSAAHVPQSSTIYLVSKTHLWVFRKTDIPSFFRSLNQAGVTLVEHGSKGSQSTSNNNLPHSKASQGINDRDSRKRPRMTDNDPRGETGKSQGTKRRVITINRPGSASQKFYACPFTKHNPERYLRFVNACTKPPGFPEIKRVKAHIAREHSAAKKCPLCGHAWDDPNNFEAELNNHLDGGHCTKMDLRPNKPEWTTSKQLKALKDTRLLGTDINQWVTLWQCLYPDEWPIPSPYYEYWTLDAHVVSDTNVVDQSEASEAQARRRPAPWRIYEMTETIEDQPTVHSTANPDLSKSADASAPTPNSSPQGDSGNHAPNLADHGSKASLSDPAGSSGARINDINDYIGDDHVADPADAMEQHVQPDIPADIEASGGPPAMYESQTLDWDPDQIDQADAAPLDSTSSWLDIPEFSIDGLELMLPQDGQSAQDQIDEWIRTELKELEGG